MTRLAFYTCGMLRGRAGESVVDGFFQLGAGVFGTAAGSRGFIAHMMDRERGWPQAAQEWDQWGPFAVPAFYAAVPDWQHRLAATLSIWEDAKSVRSFAYSGIHAQALKQRVDWFEQNGFPSYVMWWVGENDVPTWSGGAARLSRLHENGPTADGFTFSSVWPPGQVA